MSSLVVFQKRNSDPATLLLKIFGRLALASRKLQFLCAGQKVLLIFDPSFSFELTSGQSNPRENDN